MLEINISDEGMLEIKRRIGRTVYYSRELGYIRFGKVLNIEIIMNVKEDIVEILYSIEGCDYKVKHNDLISSDISVADYFYFIEDREKLKGGG